MMFGFRGVFARKPRQFDYRPRYFDPVKERREQRKQELLGPDHQERPGASDAPGERYVPGAYIRRNMLVRRGMGRAGTRKSGRGLRLAVILVVLGVGVWWVLSTGSIQELLSKWLTR